LAQRPGNSLIVAAQAMASHVIGLNARLAVDSAPWGINRSTASAPARDHTGITAGIPDRATRESTPAPRAAAAATGIPEEVANMTLSLVLPAGRHFLKRLHIRVDGGMSIKNACPGQRVFARASLSPKPPRGHSPSYQRPRCSCSFCGSQFSSTRQKSAAQHRA